MVEVERDASIVSLEACCFVRFSGGVSQVVGRVRVMSIPEKRQKREVSSPSGFAAEGEETIARPRSSLTDLLLENLIQKLDWPIR